METKRLLPKALFMLLLSMMTIISCSEKEEDGGNSGPVGTTNLQVTPSKLSFTAAGGTQTLTVRTTYSKYGYDIPVDWLHGGFKDDPTYNYVTITAEPNTSPTARTATIKVTGANSDGKILESVSVNVEQEGKSGSGESSKTYTVEVQGGTIEHDNIGITIPANTYDSNKQIAVKTLEPGKTAIEEEVSPFYEVSLPADSKKPIQISIKSDAKGDDIGFIAHAPGVVLHDENHKIIYNDIRLASTYKDGSYTATIPAIDDKDNPEKLKISFGLVRMTDNKSVQASSRSTRSETDGDIKWHKIWDGSKLGEKYIERINPVIDNAMNEAVKIIKDLGFKVSGDRDIPLVLVHDLGESTHGIFVQSTVKDSWSSIKLNSSLIASNYNNPLEIKSTILHELFHYFQSEYDPVTSPYLKGSFYGDLLDDSNLRMRVYEAGGVWIEKYVDDEGFYDSDWKMPFSYVLQAPFSEGTGSYDTGLKASQIWGYGSAPILDWFVSQKSASAILNLHEVFKKGGNTTFMQWIEAGEKATGAKFRSKFNDYATDMCEGKLIHGIRYGKNANYVPEDKKYGLFQACTSTTLNYVSVVDNGTKSHKKEVYQYGVHMTRLGVTYTNKEDRENLKNAQVILDQEEDGLTNKAWYYDEKTGKYNYLGEFSKGDPLYIDDAKIINELINKNDGTNHKSKNILIGTWMTKQDKSEAQSNLKITLTRDLRIKTNMKFLGTWFYDGSTSKQKYYVEYEFTSNGKYRCEKNTPDANYTEKGTYTLSSYEQGTDPLETATVFIMYERSNNKSGEYTTTLKFFQETYTDSNGNQKKKDILQIGGNRYERK